MFNVLYFGKIFKFKWCRRHIVWSLIIVMLNFRIINRFFIITRFLKFILVQGKILKLRLKIQL